MGIERLSNQLVDEVRNKEMDHLEKKALALKDRCIDKRDFQKNRWNDWHFWNGQVKACSKFLMMINRQRNRYRRRRK